MGNKNTIEEKTKYPYVLFYKMVGGNPIKFDGMVNAISEPQALAIFRKKYPRVRDLEAISTVWVEVDHKELESRLRAQKSSKERMKQTIENAWWNKD